MYFYTSFLNFNFRHISNEKNPDSFGSLGYKGCKTMWEGFEKTLQANPDRPFLGTRN